MLFKRNTPCPTPKDTDTPVQLIEVHKAFGSLVVLDGITLEVQRGQTTVVLGPSGAGKSVILRHIVGLIRPDKGSVYLLGCCIDKMSEQQLKSMRARVGFLFQLSALFDSMTIEENLAFPLTERTSTPRAERKRRIAQALSIVDLKGVEKKMPAHLSGGQKKRAALARALMLKPEVMLYDEPTTGLDPIRAAEIDQLINKTKEELGVTSIVVTHDMESASHIADRAVLLDEGRILADGAMEDLYACAHPRVQAFLSGGGARQRLQQNAEQRAQALAKLTTPSETGT